MNLHPDRFPLTIAYVAAFPVAPHELGEDEHDEDDGWQHARYR